MVSSSRSDVLTSYKLAVNHVILDYATILLYNLRIVPASPFEINPGYFPVLGDRASQNDQCVFHEKVTDDFSFTADSEVVYPEHFSLAQSRSLFVLDSARPGYPLLGDIKVVRSCEELLIQILDVLELLGCVEAIIQGLQEGFVLCV